MMTQIRQKVISASLSPNTSREDLLAALHTCAIPWKWKHGNALGQVEAWFRDQYDVDGVYLFQSGRVAFFEILQALQIGRGDEVLVQAFTCVAVPNSVRWAGATPVYVDIDDTLNMDAADAEKKLTSRTKAIVVQHTFGIPADMRALCELARKHKLLVIEDCAHGIGATYKGKKLGSFGDAAFFSFGRDKAISSVWGGAAIINRTCTVKGATSKLDKLHRSLPIPGFFWILQQLLHPIAFSVILPTYNSGVGKVLLVTLQRLKLLSIPVAAVELTGGQPKGSMTRYPNALARLLLVQLDRLPAMVRMRNERAAYYERRLPSKFQRVSTRDGSSYLRFPLLVHNPAAYQQSARKKGIVLGNWYHHVIDPAHTSFESAGYTPGSCIHAESVASRILNFPTRITEQDADAVCDAVIS